MNKAPRIRRLITATWLFAVMFSMPLAAQTDELDRLFVELAEADESSWRKIEQDIWQEWSKSGSAAMDLLLERGRAAMEAGDYQTAVNHFTALIDHAPDFAEGWNGRATAYFQIGLYGPSIEDIRHTLALNPRHFGALSGLGMILEQLGYPKDALKAYQEVLSIHPHRPNLKDKIERLERQVGGTDI